MLWGFGGRVTEGDTALSLLGTLILEPPSLADAGGRRRGETQGRATRDHWVHGGEGHGLRGVFTGVGRTAGGRPWPRGWPRRQEVRREVKTKARHVGSVLPSDPSRPGIWLSCSEWGEGRGGGPPPNVSSQVGAGAHRAQGHGTPSSLAHPSPFGLVPSIGILGLRTPELQKSPQGHG